MKLKPIGANQTEVSMHNGVGNFRMLYSYETPVACECTDGTFYRTEKKWSATTSKHINNWLDGRIAIEKPQSFFDDLIK